MEGTERCLARPPAGGAVCCCGGFCCRRAPLKPPALPPCARSSSNHCCALPGLSTSEGPSGPALSRAPRIIGNERTALTAGEGSKSRPALEGTGNCVCDKRPFVPTADEVRKPARACATCAETPGCKNNVGRKTHNDASPLQIDTYPRVASCTGQGTSRNSSVVGKIVTDIGSRHDSHGRYEGRPLRLKEGLFLFPGSWLRGPSHNWRSTTSVEGDPLDLFSTVSGFSGRACTSIYPGCLPVSAAALICTCTRAVPTTASLPPNHTSNVSCIPETGAAASRKTTQATLHSAGARPSSQSNSGRRTGK